MTECDGIDVERDFWGRTMLEHLTCNRFHTPENFEPRPVGKRYSDLARHKANMSERKEPEVAIYEALSDLQGYYPNQIADMLPEKLRAAGYILAPLLDESDAMNETRDRLIRICQENHVDEYGQIQPESWDNSADQILEEFIVVGKYVPQPSAYDE